MSVSVSSRRLHPWPVRIMHWTNALAMIVMITSGWGIYDDDVIIGGLHFDETFRLGSWAAESLLWHFAGMWFLALNGLAYLLYGVITGGCGSGCCRSASASLFRPCATRCGSGSRMTI